MPNALTVFANLAHTVKGHPMNPALRIHELKCLWTLRRKADLLQRNQDYPVLRSVVITQLKAPSCKLRIPPDAVEQFVNGGHREDRSVIRTPANLLQAAVDPRGFVFQARLSLKLR